MVLSLILKLLPLRYFNAKKWYCSYAGRKSGSQFSDILRISILSAVFGLYPHVGFCASYDASSIFWSIYMAGLSATSPRPFICTYTGRGKRFCDALRTSISFRLAESIGSVFAAMGQAGVLCWFLRAGPLFSVSSVLRWRKVLIYHRSFCPTTEVGKRLQKLQHSWQIQFTEVLSIVGSFDTVSLVQWELRRSLEDHAAVAQEDLSITWRNNSTQQIHGESLRTMAQDFKSN